MAGLELLEPGVRRIVAPNPSPMTLTGTCTYIVGTGEVAVIDPGPENPAHLRTILESLAPNESVSHIFVTHAHLDHSPGAAPLAALTGAQVYAFGPPSAGRSAVMQALAARADVGGGEGVHHAFRPDITLADGDIVRGTDWSLRALHTPGHFCNHLCFLFGDIAFSGDHVMGWASTLISPPDGDLGDYFRSLDKLADTASRILYPGHGAPVTEPQARIADLAAHRHDRSRQILEALTERPATAAELTQVIYTDTPKALLPAAERNVFAHLIEMLEKNTVFASEEISLSCRFSRK